jgi:hypothetical protein
MSRRHSTRLDWSPTSTNCGAPASATAVGTVTWAGRASDAATLGVWSPGDDRQRFTAHVRSSPSRSTSSNRQHGSGTRRGQRGIDRGVIRSRRVPRRRTCLRRSSDHVRSASCSIDAHHAVDLARRATTHLGLAYVLTTCGDTLWISATMPVQS